MSTENISNLEFFPESYQKIVGIEKNIEEIAQKFVDISKQVQEITHLPKEHHEIALRDVEKRSKACFEQWMHSLESLNGIQLEDTQTLSKSKLNSVVNYTNVYIKQSNVLAQKIKNLSNKEKISTESEGLTRLKVVKELFLQDIKPCSHDYSTKFVEYICSTLHVNKSDMPEQIYQDIYKIKAYYKKLKKAELMYKSHSKFFSVKIQPKRSVPLPSTVASVCFKSSHFYRYIYTR